MRKMHVIYASNDCGWPFLKVAVHTLVTHVAADKPYVVDILEGEGGVSPAHKAELLELVGGRMPVRFHDVSPFLDANRPALEAANNGRTLMIWARIFTGELLPEVDENVVYLDTDTYVNGDLEDLFAVDLGDAVLGMVPESIRGGRAGTFSRACLPPEVIRYCNSGVLLFNPATWRREGVKDSLLAWVDKWKTETRCPDQDALNALFHDRMVFLPPKWNYHDGWVERSIRFSVSSESWEGNRPQDVLEAILEPRVLHYWGGRKPWRYNHRPERLRYEQAMREVGLLKGRLEGTTALRRLQLVFFDALHMALKKVALRRLEGLRQRERSETGHGC